MDCREDNCHFALQRCGPGINQRVIQLIESESGTLVGRSEESVSLNSLYVSRQHIQVIYRSSKWFLMDLHSFNKTFLLQEGNAEKIEAFKEHEISPGAVIGLGVNPITWQSKDEYVNDEDFFVYQFLKFEDGIVNNLCEVFRVQIDV